MDEWELGKDLKVPKNLERLVKRDMEQFRNKIISSSYWKEMSSKQRQEMLKILPTIVTAGYMMSVVAGVLDGMRVKSNAKKKGGRRSSKSAKH